MVGSRHFSGVFGKGEGVKGVLPLRGHAGTEPGCRISLEDPVPASPARAQRFLRAFGHREGWAGHRGWQGKGTGSCPLIVSPNPTWAVLAASGKTLLVLRDEGPAGDGNSPTNPAGIQHPGDLRGASCWEGQTEPRAGQCQVPALAIKSHAPLINCPAVPAASSSGTGSTGSAAQGRGRCLWDREKQEWRARSAGQRAALVPGAIPVHTPAFWGASGAAGPASPGPAGHAAGTERGCREGELEKPGCERRRAQGWAGGTAASWDV